MSRKGATAPPSALLVVFSALLVHGVAAGRLVEQGFAWATPSQWRGGRFVGFSSSRFSGPRFEPASAEATS